LAREWCGKIVVVDIGLPPADPVWPVLVTDMWAGARLPKLTPRMHKGDRGRVTVVGGAHGMTGAALHAARGALAAGAGLVKLVAAKETIEAARASLPDVLTVESALGPELEPEAAEALEWADALVVGPGLGREPPRAQLLQAVLARGSAGPEAAALGAHALGRAAEHGARQWTARSLRPADVLAALPEIWRAWTNTQPVGPPVLTVLEPPETA